MTHPHNGRPRRLVVRQRFAATRADVFRAWTDPAQLRLWWGPDGYSSPAAKVDLRVGGEYRVALKPPEGGVFDVVGSYREVSPPERLVFTWASDHSQPEQRATVEFRERGESTEVVLTHELDLGEHARLLYEQAWRDCCDRLTRVLDDGNDASGSENGGPRR
jgi:uncharacterized protein YndB with AHSA1/START domain